MTDSSYLKQLQEDGKYLRFIENQTPELCLAAVKQSGFALEFVKDQTPEICLAAVKNRGIVLEYVKEQTPEICLEAIQESYVSFIYVNICPNPSYEETKENLEKLIQRNKNKEAIFDKI